MFVPPSLAYAKEAIVEVLITNTADRPVLVSGSVTVANQSLPVSGTVAVADGRQPFETRVDLSLGAGSPFDNFSFSVPAGKRLVVEFVAASVGLPSGQTPLLSANAGNGALGLGIGLERQNRGGGLVSGTASGFVYLSGISFPPETDQPPGGCRRRRCAMTTRWAHRASLAMTSLVPGRLT